MKAWGRRGIFGLVIGLGGLHCPQAMAQGPHWDQFVRERTVLQAEFNAAVVQIKACLANYRLPPSDRRLPPEAQKQNMHRHCGTARLSEINNRIGAAAVTYTHRQAADKEEAARRAAEALQRAQPVQQPKPSTKQAQPKSARSEVVLSGNWAASCVERNGGVVCQRFGGFLSNQFPQGCQGNSLLTCKGRDLCSLATEVTIVVNGNARQLQPGISSCPGARRPTI